MTVKQLSVFIENKKGRLVEAVESLAEAGIDISALSLADTAEFGVLRLIVNEAERAKEILSATGVIVKITEVLAIVMEDHPGGAGSILRLLYDNDITTEYMYACAGKTTGKALMFIRVDDPKKAERILLEKGLGRINPSDIYRI